MISRLTMFEISAMKLLLGVDIDLSSFNPTVTKMCVSFFFPRTARVESAPP